MKHLILILFISSIITTAASAQCVVYTCDETGVFGAGFNNDDAPTSFQECTDVALKTCIEEGGTNCKLMHKSDVAGWWAIAVGNTADNTYLWQGVQGASSKYEAEERVKKEFSNANGYDPMVYSWYVYSNVKW